MVGFGTTSDKSVEASSSKLPSVPFASSHRTIPPPLASSTPKKSKPNGLLNGVERSGSKNTKAAPVNEDDGASQKRRKIAYMEDSEDEDHGVSLTTLNGHTNGHVNGKSESKLNHVREIKRTAELQNQCKQLPIAKGEFSLMIA